LSRHPIDLAARHLDLLARQQLEHGAMTHIAIQKLSMDAWRLTLTAATQDLDTR
jgi:hypothetical protein